MAASRVRSSVLWGAVAMTLAAFVHPGGSLYAGSFALAADPAASASPEDFVRLEERGNDLILTNISDRPINAWTIKTVVRSSQGSEAYTAWGIDAYRSPIFPGGEERLLQPGESITIPKGEEPWIREDHRGPGSGVYYEVGALTFEGGEAVGDPEIVDRIFERRLEQARTALEALAVSSAANASEEHAFDDLPDSYRRNVELYASPAEAARAIYGEAWRDYTAAVDNLRAEDRAKLPTLEEVLP